jgi:hypothetical protein
MQAGMLELWGADAIKVGRVLKIGLHHTVICCEITHYFIYKQTISAKSENRGAICETIVSENHRNFAAGIKDNKDNREQQSFATKTSAKRDLNY